MPLVDARDLLGHAGCHGYAVCAFDLAGMDFLDAAVTAAENCRAPVILSVAEPHLEYVAAEHFFPAVEVAARRCLVPIAIQFNRATSVASAVRAVRLGCNGIAANGSGHTPEERIVHTRAMVEMAHARGVPVEGGLNVILRFSNAAALSDAVTPAAARDFVQRTGVDFLTINATREPATTRPRMDFKRLAQLRSESGIPLTLDGNQRISEAEHRQLVEGGVVKITHYAGLSRSAAECVRRNVKATHRNGYLALVKGVREAIRTEAERCLRLSGSAGRASGAASHCRPWRAVEYGLVNNVAAGVGDHEVHR